jgi:hypothetical protein
MAVPSKQHGNGDPCRILLRLERRTDWTCILAAQRQAKGEGIAVCVVAADQADR